MMGTPKPLASLSSGLLARKGHARPAMRPQGYGFAGMATMAEDLGWNDLGEPPAPATAPIAAPAAVAAPVAAVQPEPIDPPPVLRQRARLQAELAAPEGPALASMVAAKPRAAFTLRLDPDRHLRLRLASALSHCSAQKLVTDALDEFLKKLPEVEDMARQLGERQAGDAE